ncbi:MAG TPA: flagellar hook-associated protein FlgK [Verrucomicrobiales bacterium]|nr:flagellar hook-associated protein FlgK [Verrucomicrobiales bacterium]
MLGLFGTLNLGARSMQTQQQGVEIAGHNLSNVNNPAYSRQRLRVESSITVPDTIGPQGTGAESTGIVQIRNSLIDRQLSGEISVTGHLQASQQALQYAQADLGQQINRSAAGGATESAGGQNGLAEYLNQMFGAWQSLSTNVTSLAERQVLLLKAQSLTTQFNQVDQRLDSLRSTLNETVASDVDKVNLLLREIGHLNDQIVNAENGTRGAANDLRDARIERIESLAKLANIQTAEQPNGMINITIAGALVVDGRQVADTLEAYDDGTGRTFVRLQTAGTPLNLTGGSISGSIAARDGGIQTLRDGLNTLAGALITEVNAIHQGGFSLTGSTGAPFFTGTNAGDIAVNAALMNDPSLLQASGTAGAVGDNTAAVAMAQLANTRHGSLAGQTFGQNYGQLVTALGQNLNVVNDQLENQTMIENLLRRQRDSVSGVSLDEEMTDLLRFQRAYQASAKLISTVDEMLEIVMGLKR